MNGSFLRSNAARTSLVVAVPDIENVSGAINFRLQKSRPQSGLCDQE